MPTAISARRPVGSDPPPRADPSRWNDRTSPPRRPGWFTAWLVGPGPADLALVAVTLAAVWGMGRLFKGWDFLAPLAVAAVASHAVAWCCRRGGVGPGLAAVVSTVGLVLVVTWLLEPETLTFGLPLGSTWQAVSADLREAWERFGVVRAPTDAEPGFLLAAAAATWVCAFLADSFAFRFQARFEALVPSFVLFLFGSVLGADQYRLAATGLYLAALLLFAVLSGARQAAAASWLGDRNGEGAAALARHGGVIAVAVVLTAVAVGPHLPGAGRSAIISWRDEARRRSTSRVTVSPLVDIRNRLVDPSGAEVFRVRSDVASYWRLTSLDRFDGTIWSSLANYRPVADRLPADGSNDGGEEVFLQQFEIRALSSIWLPAAYRPERIHGAEGVRFDPESASLLTDSATSDGLRYEVSSAQPRLTADELRLASPAVPSEVRERYLALPDAFPARVAGLAREVTGGAAGAAQPYAAARALQDWLRSSFTYDLNVPAGHDQAALERFLLVTRRGYCEQFAGAYAAMARSIGLPARVAVGFAPGRRGSDGAFSVTDAEAHAWPEVFLAGFGWVAFEPTPNRAAPGSQLYTGVAALENEPQTTPTTPPPTVGVPTTVAQGPTPGPTTASRQPGEEAGGLGWGTVAGVALVVMLVLYVITVPAARRIARARRRRGAATPTDRVLVAWQEAQEDLTLAGLARIPWETPAEYARRAGAGDGQRADALAQLAQDCSAAAFAADAAPAQVAERAERAAAIIRADVHAHAGWPRKAAWALDPRRLVRNLQESRRASGAT